MSASVGLAPGLGASPTAFAYSPRAVAVGGGALDSGSSGYTTHHQPQQELPLRSYSVSVSTSIVGGATPSSPIADSVRVREAQRRMADSNSPQFNLAEYSNLGLDGSRTYRQLNDARESYYRGVSGRGLVSGGTRPVGLHSSLACLYGSGSDGGQRKPKHHPVSWVWFVKPY